MTASHCHVHRFCHRSFAVPKIRIYAAVLAASYAGGLKGCQAVGRYTDTCYFFPSNEGQELLSMGQSPSAVQNSIGAYSYNGCARDCPKCCNCIFCCCRPLWHLPPAACCLCPACCAEGKRFPQGHPEWGGNAALRAQFEGWLTGQGMLDVIEAAPQCCGITHLQHQYHELNLLSSKVNDELLHPAGYTCDVHHWVTKGDNGGDVDHLAITIDECEVCGF